VIRLCRWTGSFLNGGGGHLVDIFGDPVVQVFHCSHCDDLKIGMKHSMFGADGCCQLRKLLIVVIVVITNGLGQGNVLGALKVHSVVVLFFLVRFGPWRAVFTGTLQW